MAGGTSILIKLTKFQGGAAIWVESTHIMYMELLVGTCTYHNVEYRGTYTSITLYNDMCIDVKEPAESIAAIVNPPAPKRRFLWWGA